jgi:hypothetical protein
VWFVLLAAALAPLSPLWVGSLPPGDPHAIALLGSRLFVGTDRGLYRAGEAGFEPVFTRSPVQDLSVGPDGLLVVTDAGLYEWGEHRQEIRARAVGAGAKIHAVAARPDGTVWGATEAGMFVRPPDASSFRRIAEIPATDVRAVRTAGTEVWAATRGTLWARREGGSFVPVRHGIPEGWWELLDAVRRGPETFLAVPFGLWRVSEAGIARSDPGVGLLRSLLAHGERLWVAAERGIFSLEVRNGTPERVHPGAPLLPVEAFDLAAGEAGLWVAARQGILRLEPSSPLAAPVAEGLRRVPPVDGRIATIHRAALAYLGLSPHRLHTLERRARWAGLWPELQASFTADRDRGRELDRDEAVSGGRLWSLRDSDTEQASALRLQIELSWDLARVAAPSDALSVSRERREVVELAERILDRVTRLYFERERALGRLGSLPLDRPEERRAAALEARELTATLDGLTGGAFSRLIGSSR